MSSGANVVGARGILVAALLWSVPAAVGQAVSDEARLNRKVSAFTVASQRRAESMRPALSLSAGAAIPFGLLRRPLDVGPAVNVNYAHPLRPMLAVEIRVGYSRLSGSGGGLEIWHYSVNAKGPLHPDVLWIVANAGPGL